jgi:hypothetical protein
LTLTTQDPHELLKHKQEMNQHKQEFASFARSVVEGGEAPAGQQFSHDHEPDEQNRMKDTENLRK